MLRVTLIFAYRLDARYTRAADILEDTQRHCYAIDVFTLRV